MRGNGRVANPGAAIRLAAFSTASLWLALAEIAYLTSTSQYLDSHDIRANALQQRIYDRFSRRGVNGARTRIIAWGRKTYVGEDPKGSARKRTE
jgi:hypothetical protein